MDATNLKHTPAPMHTNYRESDLSEAKFGWHSDEALEKFHRLIQPASNGCWIWAGPRDPYGYGNFSFGGREARAHRYSYELAKGFIHPGLVIDHLCRTPQCVNPSHLEAVTHQENIKRGVRFWEKCPHGDAFRYHRNRTCSVCRNIRRRELYAKQKKAA